MEGALTAVAVCEGVGPPGCCCRGGLGGCCGGCPAVDGGPKLIADEVPVVAVVGPIEIADEEEDDEREWETEELGAAVVVAAVPAGL